MSSPSLCTVLAAGRVRTQLDTQAVEHARDMHGLSRLIINKAIGLNAFVEAFDDSMVSYSKNGESKKGYRAKDGTNRHARAVLESIKSWVKIGGKNGMSPKDAEAMLKPGDPRQSVENAIKRVLNMQMQPVGFVFDGDNFEPYKETAASAPFSVIISELVKQGHVVLAIKNADEAHQGSSQTLHGSGGFVDGWRLIAPDHRNTFLMAVMPADTKKEAVSEMADAFIFYGSTYQGLGEDGVRTKDYRFKADKTDTQGWKEIQLLMNNSKMQGDILGENHSTFIARRIP